MSEEDPRAWLNFAEADRLSARNALNAADYRDAAFHCQQAIEKVLKAAIVAQTGQRPPYIHNLWILANAIKGLVVPDEMRDAMARINVHYITTHYPISMLMEEYMDKESAIELYELMERVYQWLMAELNLGSV